MRILLLVAAAIITSHTIFSCEQNFIYDSYYFMQDCITYATQDPGLAPRTVQLRTLNRFCKNNPKYTKKWQNDDIKTIIELLTNDKNLPNIDNAITIAALNQHNALLEILLTHLKDPTDGDKTKSEKIDMSLLESTLLWSCQIGNEEGAFLLLEKTSIQGISQTPEGQTPLSFARKRGMKRVLEALENRKK